MRRCSFGNLFVIVIFCFYSSQTYNPLCFSHRFLLFGTKKIDFLLSCRVLTGNNQKALPSTEVQIIFLMYAM